MPRLAGSDNKLNIGDARKEKAKTQEQKSSEIKEAKAPKSTRNLMESSASPVEEDDEDDEEDEVILSSKKSKDNGGGKNLKFIFIGVAVVLVVVVAFLVLGKARKKDVPVQDPNPIEQQDQTTEPVPNTPVEPEVPEIPDDTNIGTQDFRNDTTMVSDTELTDPEDFTKDIYGLTLRVDYTVAKIQEASDFVSYEKKRGTWGGGLELYYLDAEYKGKKYVIQVPFKYYKELDDSGIIPVKMEVLRIQSETDGTYLSVVSYMCLDEKTLENVLKTQNKK